MNVDPITPLTPAQVAQQQAQAAKEGYLHRDLVALDQTANVFLGGKPDETISARAARADEKGRWWGRVMSRFLDFFQSDHGPKAQAGDVERAKAVESLEDESGGFQ
jgi:hypothetical protein